MNKDRKNRAITVILLASCATILLVWDVKVATNEGSNDTISEVLRDLSSTVWLLPYMLMGVMGHLFWNLNGGDHKDLFRPDVLVGSCVVVGALDLLRWMTGTPSPHNVDVLVGLAGFVMGAKFWPQGPKWDPDGEEVDSSEEDDHANPGTRPDQ